MPPFFVNLEVCEGGFGGDICTPGGSAALLHLRDLLQGRSTQIQGVGPDKNEVLHVQVLNSEVVHFPEVRTPVEQGLPVVLYL